MSPQLLALIPALPLLGAIVNGVLNVRASRVVAGSIASAMVVLAAVLAFMTFGTIHGMEVGPHEVPSLQVTLWKWMSAGALDVDFGLRVDPLSAIMICVITGIGSLIHIYSIGYMTDEKDAKSVWRFFVYLNLFVFSMLLLVMGDSFATMFVGWEGVGLCSYLLIGFWYENTEYAKAGKKAFVTNRVGDFSFILGLFWLFWSLSDAGKAMGLNPMNFAELEKIVAANPALLGGVGGLTVTGICLLMFGGATGKSAQLPLYVWLPDAMAGPTPVSALIHAATMVTSGIYMLCRLNFLFAMAPVALAVVATIGALTALFAATIAVTQTDIKKVLAYSTVSQLGFMFLGVGVGSFAGGFFHVLTHAFFKALMFLGAGSIIHALHHEQDMRNMGGLRKYMPVTFFTFLMGYLAIIGVPGFSGFFSKDEILWLTFSTEVFKDLPMGMVMPKVLWAMATVAALFTAFYMSRLMFMTFAGSYRGGHGHDAHGHDAHGDHGHANDAHGHGHDAHGDHGHDPHESPLVLTGPLMVLALLSVVGGALNLPAWTGQHGFLHEFLHPVFTGSQHLAFSEDHSLEFPLMGLTLVGIAAAVGFAWSLYGKPSTKPAELAGKMKLLYTGSLNKWFVDEIYEIAILKPLVLGSRQVLWAVVDALVIDGAVNGAASAAQGLGTLHGRIQNGRVQAYAIGIAVGATLLVLAYALGS